MASKPHQERQWFVINLNQQQDECAPVLQDKFESTSASPLDISRTVIQVERTRGDCCGCCGCFAGCCSQRSGGRVVDESDSGLCGLPIVGAVAFAIVVVSICLLVVLVWSLQGYGSGDEVGSGGVIDDISGSGEM